METIIKNVRSVTEYRHINQKTLALKSHVSRNTINKFFSPNRSINPRLSTLVNIARALNINLVQLFNKYIDLNDFYDKDMDLEQYLNIFTQNTKLQIRGSKQKFLSSDPGIEESTISSLLSHTTSDPKLSTLTAVSVQLDIDLTILFKRGGNTI
ncbi:helix-turn-helix domain-containing protein [Latilactobacillus sp. 5-91]|uniref:helix-turn-helix domain-containing protein n=1 Tax=Latilactobacillus sp. 5-91 TaxID=3410924 RepID=UPI003C78D71A